MAQEEQYLRYICLLSKRTYNILIGKEGPKKTIIYLTHKKSEG